MVLLWGFHYLPMLDLPNHIAISDYTVRLWRREPDVTRFYELKLFAPTYRVYYALAVPLSAALGAVLATRVMVSLMWIGYVGASRALVTASALPRWTVMALAPWFFSLQFFMGLLPNLLASVFLLWSLWALLRFRESGGPKWGLLAALLGTLVTATHVVMSVLWLAALVAWALPSPRRRALHASLLASASLLPAFVWLPARASEQSTGVSSVLGLIRYLELRQYRPWLLAPSGIGEWSLDNGRAALLAGALVCIGFMGWRLGRDTRIRKCLPPPTGTVAAICLLWWLAFILGPNYVERSGAWVINVRYVELAALSTTLLAAHALHVAPMRVKRAAMVAALLAVLLQGVGLFRVFVQVDRPYHAIEEICRAIPRGATLTVSARVASAFGTGMPLAYHAHGYCSVGRAALDGGLFRDAQIPVRTVAPPAYGAAPATVLGPYDFMIYDRVAAYAEPPTDGEMVVTSGRWRLYRRRE